MLHMMLKATTGYRLEKYYWRAAMPESPVISYGVRLALLCADNPTMQRFTFYRWENYCDHCDSTAVMEGVPKQENDLPPTIRVNHLSHTRVLKHSFNNCLDMFHFHSYVITMNGTPALDKNTYDPDTRVIWSASCYYTCTEWDWRRASVSHVSQAFWYVNEDTVWVCVSW